MIVEESTDYKTIKEILTNPVLFRLTAGQSLKLDEFEVNTYNRYLLIKNENEIVGCFQLRDVTHQVLEVHIYILPKYWGKNISHEAAKIGHAWAKKQGYLKTFTTAPATATHVLKFLQQIHYRVCGMIEKGTVYNKVLCTLFLYEFEV